MLKTNYGNLNGIKLKSLDSISFYSNLFFSLAVFVLLIVLLVYFLKNRLLNTDKLRNDIKKQQMYNRINNENKEKQIEKQKLYEIKSSQEVLDKNINSNVGSLIEMSEKPKDEDDFLLISASEITKRKDPLMKSVLEDDWNIVNNND